MSTKPRAGEARYVDLDDDTALWCVFGVDSGYAYSSHASADEARDTLARSEARRRDHRRRIAA